VKAFVSGGAGVIGRELVSRLVSQGVQVIVGDLQPRPDEFREGVEYIHGDLNELKVWPECDVFYHLAATFERLEESPEHWEKNFRHNVQLSHHLLTLCKASRIVFASSYLVFDGFHGIAPRNLTGAAKFYTECELLSLAKANGIEACIGRIYRVYGKGSKDVISRWIRSMLRGEEVTMYNPHSSYDYIYAGDVAGVLMCLPPGIHEVGTGKATLVFDLLLDLKEHFSDAKIKVERGEKPGHEKLDSCIPVWNCTPLKEGIKKVIEYERGRCVP
jgi:carbamoyl-phosphate synthase large subunit